MHKRLILFFVIAMLICFNSEGKTDPVVKRAYKVASEFIHKKTSVDKKFVVHGTGIGGGLPSGKLRHISIDFVTYQNLNLAEARQLYVKLVEEFKDMINAHKDMEQSMDTFPCTYKGTNLTLAFENEKYQHVDPPYIAYISIYDNNKGNICYRTYNKNTNNFHEEDYEENYEEALRIVKGQSLLGALPQSPSKN